jgi:peptidylprolyl isomerase/FKBP-type peptidyl-prolyl cis-trans isomerase FkpA
MLSKFEAFGIGLSVIFMALALYLMRVETTFLSSNQSASQSAQLIDSGVVIVGDGEDVNSERKDALMEATSLTGDLNKLVIEDITIGTGDEVKVGDEVLVHYVGKLQDGTEFDNSQKRGEPFLFEVGGGRVIQGWEQGLIGMKVGGQRILGIPPDLGYGARNVGPIPANSTLVFSIELLEIK